MVNAIEKIELEHKDYGHVLASLRMAVKKLRGGEWRRQAGQDPEGRAGYRPNLDLLFSIIYYIRVFPEKFHHPKEEDFLFKALRERKPDSGGILDQLAQQHSAGAHQIDELDAALKAYQANFPDGLETLESAAETFVSGQFEHMQMEEEKVIPIAKAVLTEDDWHAINRAFAKNNDPMFGENLEAGFHALHNHILNEIGAA
jgi:branched-chain amino acid transport system ATP-binding protein